MRLYITLIALILVLQVADAFGSSHQHSVAPEYNTWSSKELKQWLTDNDVSIKAVNTRDDLLALVKKNWNKHTSSSNPFSSWSNENLASYLESKGVQLQKKGEQNRKWLVDTAQETWEKGTQRANDARSDASDWVFDNWSDSTLRKFAEKYNIKTKSSATKDELLASIKKNYSKISKEANHATSQSMDWLYQSWSDSDLVEWLTTNGYSVPAHSSRADLIALAEHYSRAAHKTADSNQKWLSDSFQNLANDLVSTYGGVKESALSTWSESDLSSWLASKGISVPEQSTKDQMIASVIQHKDLLVDDVYNFAKHTKDKITSGFETAHENANAYAEDSFRKVVDLWSDSRLKDFLRARGVIAPEDTPTERLRQLVWKHRRDPVTGWGAWSFESWSTDDLRDWLSQKYDATGGWISEKYSAASDTREQMARKSGELVESAQEQGGDAYNSLVKKLSEWYAGGKQYAFDSWTDSDLRAYIASFDASPVQKTTRQELIDTATKYTNYFQHGSNDRDSWSATLDKAGQYLKSGLQGAADGTKKLSDKVSQGIKSLRDL